jgi:Cof subfamily protein (haloacid dehalogenase superfamily)
MNTDPVLPSLVATDLDGTLLDREGRVSDFTRRILEELDRRDVPVVFVTGRPTRWMETLWDAVGGHGLAICSNGAVVYDVAEHRIRSALTIDPATAAAVATRLREALPGTAFALEKTDVFAREPTFRAQHADPPGIEVGEFDALCDDRIIKLLALHREIVPETYWQRVEEAVGDLVTVTWSSVNAMVEISAHGVTKASTLERLCAEMGVLAEDVVAFGDMPNDVAMLQWAGSSYAMADAHPAAIAAATHRAPGHDVDGVASVLDDVFGLGLTRSGLGRPGSFTK